MSSGRRLVSATVALVLISAASFSLYWLLHSRATAPLPGESSRSSAGGSQPRLLFIGLDGADWQYLDVLMTQGVMPNLTRLVAEGHGGALRTIYPPLSPLVWTTMMTGVGPIEHGILDFTRFNPVTGTVEPITSDERRVPAVWNMVTQRGASACVIGLWATYPAEKVSGVVVSDRFVSATHTWSAPEPSRSIFPADRDSWAKEIAANANRDVSMAAVRAYLPWLGESDYEGLASSEKPFAHPVSAMRQLLVELRETTDLALSSLDRDHPTLAVVYYEGTDVVGHVFAPYAPPRQEGITQEDFDRYSRVPELYFRDVDRCLGSYRTWAEKNGAILMIASDHGFRWREGRPTELSSVASATAAKWHREDGIYLLWGRGISADPGHPEQGSVLHVCSTILALLGMPQGKGLLGPALPGSPGEVVPPQDYAADFKRSSAVASGGPGESEELEKLKTIGYIESTATTTARQRRGPDATRTASSFNNEGILYRARGDVVNATRAFERARELDPKYASACWNLSDLLFAEGRDLERADELLIKALSLGMPDGEKKTVGRVVEYQKTGKGERARALLNRAIELMPSASELRMLRGGGFLEQKRCREALADFDAAARLAPENALAQASLGVANLCLGDRDHAVQAFEKSLQIDPNQPQIKTYLDQIRK